MAIMALQKDKDGNILPIGSWKDGFSLDGTSSAVSSSVLDPNASTDIRIVAETACHILFGTNPTATSSVGSYIPADNIVDIRIPAGYKISVYGGILNVTPYGGKI